MKNRFSLQLLSPVQKQLRLRLLSLSHKLQVSHLGSCFTSIDLIEAVYSQKQQSEKFVLSNGHAGLALYTVLEHHRLLPSSVIKNLNIHPDRNPQFSIDVSTGSLGQGLPIALGMALANRHQNVYCLTSDGECAEGSIWETLRLSTELKVNNLKIILNANGWGAYGPVKASKLLKQIRGFGFKPKIVDGHDLREIIQTLKMSESDKPQFIFAKTSVNQFQFLKGLSAHYYKPNHNDYMTAIEALQQTNKPHGNYEPVIEVLS